ncbi:CAP domain-containing protein [Streptomyces sp. RFCAC02]|uniref:CAP domain-containing protein n=1 Tax=Streptomyces sp. RFCAC02 TaxID=2499143 RepID=UPI001F0D7281|nr:CAP domain-containing protein [Streptomyces sp. RFCAC02]
MGVGSGLLPGMGDAFAPSDSPASDDTRAQPPEPSLPVGSVSPEASASPSADRTAQPEESRSPERETTDASSSPAEETEAPQDDESTSEAEETPSADDTADDAPDAEETEATEESTPSDEPTTEATEPAEDTATEPAPEETVAPDPADDGSGSAADEQLAAAQEVLSLVNAERAAAGLRSLTLDPSLSALANAYSADMAARGFFDHTDPDGRTPWDRAADAGILNLGGENIARGQVDAEAVVEAWMASEGHRDNILNPVYTTMGLGVQFGDGGPWWTQVFGY